MLRFAALLLISSVITAEQSPSIPDSVPTFVAICESEKSTPSLSTASFEPFTGKVSGSKVRMRLQPTLDSAILCELTQGDLVVVDGEVDEFYALKPGPHWKGYVYRAYVLDDIVEASNVNVRLEPNTVAPILAQLGQGDQVKGQLCSTDNKWLEIELPQTVYFYVSKSYISNVGNIALYQKTRTRKEQLEKRLASLQETVQNEFQKSFPTIQLMPIVNDLKELISQNQEFPEVCDQAQSTIKNIQERYIALGQTSEEIATVVEEPAQQEIPIKIEENLLHQQYSSFSLAQQEATVLQEALAKGKASTRQGFYEAQIDQSEELIGQLIPYEKSAKNRPGDYILVHEKTKVPMAYLYSTLVDLTPHIGQIVKIETTSRDNHHYALPAYFVLTVIER